MNAQKLTKINSGFSLIELIIVVAIVGILAAIAYPVYTEQIERTRRSDAHVALLNLAAKMEFFYTENNTYHGALTPANVGSNILSTEGFYELSITNQSDNTYTLTATPLPNGPQANDKCGALTLTHMNVKGPSADCW